MARGPSNAYEVLERDVAIVLRGVVPSTTFLLPPVHQPGEVRSGTTNLATSTNLANGSGEVHLFATGFIRAESYEVGIYSPALYSLALR